MHKRPPSLSRVPTLVYFRTLDAACGPRPIRKVYRRLKALLIGACTAAPAWLQPRAGTKKAFPGRSVRHERRRFDLAFPKIGRTCEIWGGVLISNGVWRALVFATS